MRARWFSILLIFVSFGARAEAPPIAAKSWFLLDYHSGAVLGEQNADQALEPASLTKLMTAYLVFDALKSGRLSLKHKPAFSFNAFQAAGARLPIDPKQATTVDELLQGMIVLSANDAAIQLAEAVSGREDVFVRKMNEQARRFGLKTTRYLNVTGQPMPGHVSSARDVAMLSARLIRDFPEFYPRYRQKSFAWNGSGRTNRNLLLWRDATVDGLKTGTTKSAGYCLAASSRRGDRRVIAVVLGASSEEARAVETQKLLNYGMSAFDTPVLYKAGQRLATLPVWQGLQPTVHIKTQNAIFATIPADGRRYLRAEIKTKKPLTAPIRQGQALGQVVVYFRDKIVGEFPAVAESKVEAAGWWGRTFDRLKMWWTQS